MQLLYPSLSKVSHWFASAVSVGVTDNVMIVLALSDDQISGGASEEIHALDWQVRQVAFPLGPVWWHWRNYSRILQVRTKWLVTPQYFSDGASYAEFRLSLEGRTCSVGLCRA